MKARLDQWVVTVAFCSFLGIMAALFFLLPKEEYSQLEKKVLAQFPEISAQSITSGTLDDQIELYMAEHLPGRAFFVGVDAYFRQLTLRQIAGDIYPAAGDRLVEEPVTKKKGNLTGKLSAIQGFAAAAGQPVELMLIPSAGWVAGDTIRGITPSYRDEEIIESIYAMAGPGVTPVNVTQLYKNRPMLYYRTDHHWTSEGAYLAGQAYCRQKGISFPEADTFTVEKIPGFYGSTYSRSGLWLTAPDTLELWHGAAELTVTLRKPGTDTLTEYDSVFFRDRLQEMDMYTAFLDGNNALVRIRNAGGSGKLLIIRDSYSNCLAPFLAQTFEEVVLVDLRYWNVMTPVSQLLEQEEFDHILVCYSLYNFVTDANIPLLR